MTVVVDEMLIRIAADTAQLRNDVNDMRRHVGSGFDDIKDRANSLKSVLGSMFAGVAVGAVAKQFVETADAMSLLDARLKQTTGNAADFSAAQAEIYRIAQANNAGLKETAELFTKLNEPVKRLGGGVKETAAIVDAFSTSMRLGGASTEEAAGATLQFAQAMGSGKLQGDEFRSIAEASPRFMKAMADGMHVPIEKLKEMGSEGKLTADVVGNALIKSLDQLKSEAGNMPDTVSGAFQRMKNDMMVAVNDLNKNSGLTLGIAGLISGVNELLPKIKNELAGAFEAVGDWIARNRSDLREAWDTAAGLVGDVWEIAKAMANVVGFTVEAGNKMGVFKTVLETIRFLVAGVEDGVTIIGAAFAKVGADIIDYVAAPMRGLVEMVGRVASAAGIELGKNLLDAGKAIDGVANRAREYADGVYESFARGESAVGKVNAELLRNKEAAAASASGMQVASEVMDALSGATDREVKTLVVLKAKSAEATKEQKEALEHYKKLIKSIQDKNGELLAEVEGQKKLTEAEKLALKVMNDIRDGTLKLTAAQKVKTTAALEELLATEKLTDAQKEEQKILKEVHEQRIKDAEAMLKQVEAMDEQTQKIKDENSVLAGTAKSLDALELARMKDRRAILEQIVATDKLKGYCNDETEAHRETLRALNDLIAARDNNIHLKAAKETSVAWTKAADDIGKSLTDAFMRSFESGKSFGASFIDTLKNMAKTQLAKGLSDSLSDMVGSLFGKGGSGGSSGLFSGIASLFGKSGASGGASSGAGMMGGAGSVAGWIGLGMMVNDSLYKQGWNPDNGTMSAFGAYNPWTGPSVGTGKVLKALGLDSRTASLLSGSATVARLFGRKDREVTEAGIYGGIGGSNFSGVSYENWLEKGGLFRSDKSGSQGRDLDSARDAMLDAMAKDTLSMVSNLADSLKLPIGNLGSIVTEARIKLTGDAEKDQAAINEVFVKYRDELTGSFAGVLEPFHKAGEAMFDTLQRVAMVQGARETLNGIGGVFSKIAQGGMEATEAMISLAGGLDQLLGKANQFVKDFYTEQEQAGLSAREILTQLQKVGINAGSITSKEEYRSLVESRDVNSSLGREQLNALLTLGPQFANIAGFMAENKASLDELAKSAPLIAALDPMFARQAEAVNQSTAAIDATTAAVSAVQGAVTAGTSATVAAIGNLAGSIQSAISSVAQSAAASSAALSARIDAVESNSRLAASAPY